MMADFKNSLTVGLSSKLATRLLNVSLVVACRPKAEPIDARIDIPVLREATAPCDICLQLRSLKIYLLSYYFDAYKPQSTNMVYTGIRDFKNATYGLNRTHMKCTSTFSWLNPTKFMSRSNSAPSQLPVHGYETRCQINLRQCQSGTIQAFIKDIPVLREATAHCDICLQLRSLKIYLLSYLPPKLYNKLWLYFYSISLV